MRISWKVRASFVFNWPINEQCPAPFHDLFEEPVEQQGMMECFNPASSLKQDKEILMLEGSCNVKVISEAHLQYPAIYARAAYFYLLGGENGKPEHRNMAMREAGRILNGFKLNPDVARRLDESIKTLKIDQCIGVHVRRGDVRPPQRVAVSSYFQRLEHSYPENHYFVASEDEDVLERFQWEFAGRVRVYPAHSRVRTERIAVQDALIEMLLLSRTRLIVTGPSSFTEVAAMMGGKGREVLRPGG